jgi:uncharacterized membrane protein
MTSRWQRLFNQITGRLWFRAALFSVLGILTAILAAIAQPLIPADIPAKIGADSVDNILTIIASSMLAVTIFSLSAMVAAYAAASNSVTPRATKLLIQDPTTQNALATFIGSFLFSLVGIIALSTGIYGSQGRVVLFAMTLLVIALVVITLLRWIDHLARLGRVGETTERIEQATAKALRQRRDSPTFGASRWFDPRDIPADAAPIFAQHIGYVQHIDLQALSRAVSEEANLYVGALPGAFVDCARPLAWRVGGSHKRYEEIRQAFTIDAARSFDQDPRIGLSVLAEIASRALSPALNDPGTAIDVIGRAVRVLSLWAEEPKEVEETCFASVFLPALCVEDMFDDVFTPIARDGAAILEVQLRLQKALRSLAAIDEALFGEAAKRHSRLALQRAEAAMTLEDDRARLRAIAL